MVCRIPLGFVKETACPKFKTISEEINKHTVAELSDLYRGVDLSKEKTIAIRSVVSTISNRLSQLGSLVNLQDTESFRRNIYFNNPSLR